MIYTFFFGHAACGIFVPWPGIEPAPPAPLNHWTARKVLIYTLKRNKRKRMGKTRSKKGLIQKRPGWWNYSRRDHVLFTVLTALLACSLCPQREFRSPLYVVQGHTKSGPSVPGPLPSGRSGQEKRLTHQGAPGPQRAGQLATLEPDHS